MNTLNYKKLNKLCIITILVSTILGYLNPYEKSMAIIYHFWYSIVMFIYFVNTKIARKISISSIIPNGLKNYANDYCKRLVGKFWKIFMIGSLCCLKIFFLIVQIYLNVTKPQTEFNFHKNTFLLNNSFLMLVLATVAEIAVVIIFSKRIWRENGGDDIILCQ